MEVSTAEPLTRSDAYVRHLKNIPNITVLGMSNTPPEATLQHILLGLITDQPKVDTKKREENLVLFSIYTVVMCKQ